MKYKTLLVSLVTLLALAVLATNVSAFGKITSVEINGEEVFVNGRIVADIAAFAGETLPVRVSFEATADAEDARLRVWISGAREFAVTTERIHVLKGSTYSKLVSVQVPFDLDPSEELTLRVGVESENEGDIEEVEIPLAAQRESYIVEILDVNMPNRVSAGETLALDIVLKNRGFEFAEDTFVKVRIPALGIENRAFFGDLSDVDQPIVDDHEDRLDKEDTSERRLFLSIPSSTKAGVYDVEIEAYNADSATTLAKKIAVVGASEESMVIAPVKSKTFAVGEKATYSLTLVNAGTKVRLYELTVDSPAELRVDLDEPIVVVPAGSSATVKLMAQAQKAGMHTFVVNVLSDGNFVKTETLSADVEGKTRAVATGVPANTTVVLTVVLAIIFVVLLVVLIVLLTRKPEKTKETNESYY